MRLFITAPFRNGANKEEIENLCRIIKESGFIDFCFIRDVENYQKIFHVPKELMERAREEIIKSDALLLDMANKPTGRAIEAGIAYALNKRIIVIMKKGTTIKDTVRGIADAVIEYDDLDDIIPTLKQLLSHWQKDCTEKP